jgi:hypothetical protein
LYSNDLFPIVRVVEDRDTGERGNEFLEHLESFARQLRRNAGRSRHFTDGSRDADHHTFERIAGDN